MLSKEQFHFNGEVACVLLETSEDLSKWLPEGIVPEDAGLLLLKSYRLHRAALDRSPLERDIHQYQQVCVSVVAGDAGWAPVLASKHWNFVMWNDQLFSFEANIEMGNRKRLATIETSYLAPEAEARVFGAPDRHYETMVSRASGLLLDLTIDGAPGEAGTGDEMTPPPYSGVISPYPPAPGTDEREALMVTLVDDVHFDQRFTGNVTLSVGESTGQYEAEALALLASASPIAGGVFGVSWTLPEKPHVPVHEPAGARS